MTGLGQKPKSGFYTLQGWLNCATATTFEKYLLVQNMFTRCMLIIWKKIWSDMRGKQPDTFCLKVLQWQVLLQWHIINCSGCAVAKSWSRNFLNFIPLKILKSGLINTISVCLYLMSIHILHWMSCGLNIDYEALLHNSQCHLVEIATA